MLKENPSASTGPAALAPPFSADALAVTKPSSKQYLFDFGKVSGRGRAALIGCLLLVAVSPSGLSTLTLLIMPTYAMKAGTPIPVALLPMRPLALRIAGRRVDRYGARKFVIPAVIAYAVFTAATPLVGGSFWCFRRSQDSARA